MPSISDSINRTGIKKYCMPAVVHPAEFPCLELCSLGSLNCSWRISSANDFIVSISPLLLLWYLYAT